MSSTSPNRETSTAHRKHRALIAATKPPCAICGQPIDYTIRYPHPDAYTLDHVVPVARGGSDSLSNKQPAHNRCNKTKMARTHAAIIKTSGTLTLPK